MKKSLGLQRKQTVEVWKKNPVHCSQCFYGHGVLLPSVQQPSVPLLVLLLVVASSAWFSLHLEKNPFLSVTLQLPSCLLPAPQYFPTSAPPPGCVLSLPHGHPSSPHPLQAFTCPKGRAQDVQPRRGYFTKAERTTGHCAEIRCPCSPSLPLSAARLPWKTEIPLASGASL